MKHLPRTLKLAVAGVAVLGAGLVLAPGAAQALLSSADTSASDLSDAQVVAMYEEERLAGDVYDQLADDTDALIFTNIAAAEERHQAAVATLLQARGIDVGDLPSAPGEYTTAGYGDMYTQFVSDGQKSLADAYAVGVAIESADIADLQDLLTQTSDPAEVRVLTALLNGSQHHLAAFSGEPTTGPTGQTLMNQNRYRMQNGYGQGQPGGARVQHQAQNGSGPNSLGPNGSGPNSLGPNSLGPNGSGPFSSTPGECDGTGPGGMAGGGQQHGYGR